MTDLYERFSTSSVRSEARSPVAKDRDRLIHCSAFRRLQGKSQIVGVEAGDFFRTRLTHSLECAQVGRALATNLLSGGEWEAVVEKPDDFPDLVEAACLAHDLGHPPFGHNGEQALRERMEDRDGTLFEGNAQSFRIVTFLEPKVYEPSRAGSEARWLGLDLTRATLRAVIKYPNLETQAMRADVHPKFGVYDDPVDREYWDWVWDGETPAKTIAAEVMDVADEIAYAAHDFEDGVWAGMIPLHGLLNRNPHVVSLLEGKVKTQDSRGLFGGGEFDAALSDLLDPSRVPYLTDVGFDRTRHARAALKNFTAELLGELITAVTPGGTFVSPFGDVARRIALLKGMAWQWMIERTDIETRQYGQRRLVARIFDGYWERPEMLPRREEWDDVAKHSSPSRVSWFSRRNPRERWPEKARVIRDHVAGMTDGYALQVYDQMYRGRVERDLRLAY